VTGLRRAVVAVTAITSPAAAHGGDHRAGPAPTRNTAVRQLAITIG